MKFPLLNSIFVLSIFFYIIFSTACTNDEAELPQPSCIDSTVSFKDDIVPILTTYCYFPNTDNACHTSGNDATAPISLENYASVFALKTAINNRSIVQKDMPPSYTTIGDANMDACAIEKLEAWLDEGAMDN